MKLRYNNIRGIFNMKRGVNISSQEFSREYKNIDFETFAIPGIEYEKYIIDDAFARDFRNNNLDRNEVVNFPDILSLPFSKVALYTTHLGRINSVTYLSENIPKKCININFATDNMRFKFNISVEKENGMHNVDLDVKNIFVSPDKNKLKISVMLNELAPYLRDKEGIKNIKDQKEVCNYFIKTASEVHSSVIDFFVMLYCKKTIIGKSKEEFTVRPKSKYGRSICKISRFTTISTHRLSKLRESVYSNVEWSHGFWVSGHWRKTKDIRKGKDRNGNYIVEGFTWIKPHTRKDELGIIEKTRVIN